MKYPGLICLMSSQSAADDEPGDKESFGFHSWTKKFVE